MRTLFASWHRTLLCTLAMLAFVGGAALADVPTPPLLLGASVSFQGNDAYGTLGWYGNDSLNWNNNSYRVYQISGYDTTDTFTLVATITDTSIRGSYTMPLDPGVYTFYVTAFNDSGESPRSNYVSLVVPSFHITIDPNAVADSIEVGTPYSYQVHAWASDSSEIHYQIVSPQPGMTIDSLTGVFSWTPAYSGRYHIRVRAYSWPTWNVEASMWLSIFVQPQAPVLCATLNGTVSYSDNTPVLSGTVTAIPNDSFSVYTPTASIVNGAYQLSVEGGLSYRIRVSGNDFYTETTINQYSAACDSADSVPLIYVRHYLPQAYDTVSGRVLRLADSSPVDATVIFYRDSIGGYSRTTRTYGNGYYDIILDHGADSTLYYVRAIPDDNDLYEQYYYHAPTASGATPIWVSGHRTNVDFDLEAHAVYNNSVSGFLVNEDNIPLYGTVVAYAITTRDSVQAIEYVDQASAVFGSYSFSDLEPGTYILFGMSSDSGTYAPGYYLEGDFAAQSWELGTQITVTASSHDSLLVIKLDSIHNQGRNLLRGGVTDNAGAAGRVGRILQGTKPLAGANVYAVDANDRIGGYATTNQDGEFVISNLGVGVYQIVVDKIGYRGSTSIVTFTEDNTEKELPGVGLDRVGSTSSVPVVTGGASGLAVYPNPARGSVNISFTATYGEVRLTMTNAAGVEVRSGSVATVDGANTVRLETGDLGSGLYFVRIAGARGISTVPVTIVR